MFIEGRADVRFWPKADVIPCLSGTLAFFATHDARRTPPKEKCHRLLLRLLELLMLPARISQREF
jgi:hypothetical protein